MSRKAFLLRIDPNVLAAVQKWAEDELRSLNGHIEYLLRQALLHRGKKLPPLGNSDSLPTHEGEPQP
jgi:hypothetical protein